MSHNSLFNPFLATRIKMRLWTLSIWSSWCWRCWWILCPEFSSSSSSWLSTTKDNSPLWELWPLSTPWLSSWSSSILSSTHVVSTTHYRWPGVRTIYDRALRTIDDRAYALSRKGRDRLTCTAQPGHGGKRRDSPKERVSSAITEFMHVIDHKQNDLNEIKDSDITFETLEWLGASSS